MPSNFGLPQASSPEQLSKTQPGITREKLIVRKKYRKIWASHRPARQNSYQNLNLESPEKN